MSSTSSGPMILPPPAPGSYVPSSDSTKVDTGIASSESEYARKFLPLVNRLRSIQLDRYIDLPIIAVIGSQSAGKSSLIQAISGISLPRDVDACTRCPIECRLSRSEQEWSCQVSLRMVWDDSDERSTTRDILFGEPITDRHMVEERVQRAQRAILSPSFSPDEFLTGDRLPDAELTFSENIVCLDISGVGVADLAFVDLPGLIRTTGSSGDARDISLIEGLAKSYISRPNCIILLTVACETHFANQGAHELARRIDPKGERTVGVLTKPDRIVEGEEDRWTRYIRGEDEPLHHGWFCVKQPDQRSIRMGTSAEVARNQEQSFFEKVSAWADLPTRSRMHLGTPKLVKSLETALSSLISKRIPELSVIIGDDLAETERELRSLPKPVSTDSVGEIYQLMHNFTATIKSNVSGKTGVLLEIQPEYNRFKAELRATAPDFRAWNKDLANAPEIPLPEFLADEENRSPVSAASREPIFLDEVMAHADKSTLRRNPDSSPSEGAERYFRQAAEKWKAPTEQLVDRVYRILLGFVLRSIHERFDQFSEGGLPQHVAGNVKTHLTTCHESTLEKVRFFLKLEQKAITDNKFYFREYKSSFSAYYMTQRMVAKGDLFFKNLQLKPFNPNGKYEAPSDFKANLTNVKNALAKTGMYIKDPMDLAKLAPVGDTDSALETMATASALFEVAFKRFTDYIQLAVDEELVWGLGEGVYEALHSGFNFDDARIVEQCKNFLQEAPETATRRRELQEKSKRLGEARVEISDSWTIWGA